MSETLAAANWASWATRAGCGRRMLFFSLKPGFRGIVVESAMSHVLQGHRTEPADDAEVRFLTASVSELDIRSQSLSGWAEWTRVRLADARGEETPADRQVSAGTWARHHRSGGEITTNA